MGYTEEYAHMAREMAAAMTDAELRAQAEILWQSVTFGSYCPLEVMLGYTAVADEMERRGL